MKIFRSVLVAVVLLLASPLYAAPQAPSDAQLQKWFEYYNDTLFAGKLPPTTVKWANLTLQDSMGMASCELVDKALRCTIVLDRETNTTERTIHLTLIHETCHVAIDASPAGKEFDAHGPRFQACMMTRAMEGTFGDIW